MPPPPTHKLQQQRPPNQHQHPEYVQYGVVPSQFVAMQPPSQKQEQTPLRYGHSGQAFVPVQHIQPQTDPSHQSIRASDVRVPVYKSLSEDPSSTVIMRQQHNALQQQQQQIQNALRMQQEQQRQQQLQQHQHQAYVHQQQQLQQQHDQQHRQLLQEQQQRRPESNVDLLNFPTSVVEQAPTNVTLPPSTAKEKDVYLDPTSTIDFFLNGIEQNVLITDPTLTLNDYIRSCDGLSGTKISCGEGGCGACVVAVTYDTSSSVDSSSTNTISVNSCLYPLASCDSVSITTVEAIGSTKTTLNPIQETLAQCSGSQCGFCSPGMVMSMYSLLQANPDPSPSEIEAQFDGNICRCTGYRPILSAMQTFASDSAIAADPLAPSNHLPRITGGHCRADAATSEALQLHLPGAAAGTSTPKVCKTTGLVCKGTCGGKKAAEGCSDIEDLSWVRPKDIASRRLAATDVDDTVTKKSGNNRKEHNPRSLKELHGVDPREARPFPAALRGREPRMLHFKGHRSTTVADLSSARDTSDPPVVEWYSPTSLDQVFSVLTDNSTSTCKIIRGNTGSGVMKYYETLTAPDVIIDVRNVTELMVLSQDNDGLIVGAATTITDFIAYLEAAIASTPGNTTAPFAALVTHLYMVANVPVRNAGSVGGNLMMAQSMDDFPSDIFTILLGIGATVTIAIDNNASTTTLDLIDFETFDMTGAVLQQINVPFGTDDQSFCTYKQGLRHQNSHAIVNAAFNITSSISSDKSSGSIVTGAPILAFGGINAKAVRASKTEAYLVGQDLTDEQVLQTACTTLQGELTPDSGPGIVPYRQSLAISFFYKFILSLQPGLPAPLASATELFVRPVSSGVQSYGTDPSEYPMTEAIPKIEALEQTSGEIQYINDLAQSRGALCGAFVFSTEANATIDSVDSTAALASVGVVAYFDASDLPNSNSYSATPVPAGYEETIFADGSVCYYGQPIAMVVADTDEHARAAALLVSVKYGTSQPGIFTLQDAINAKSFFPFNDQLPVFTVGDLTTGFASADNVLTGVINAGSQYHYTMETQSCVVVPEDGGSTFAVSSSTQWPAMVQAVVANTLGINQSKVTCDVKRVGGAYGGKITRALLPPAAAAVAANALNVPVKIVMSIDDNMLSVGKRHPFQCQYKMGLMNDGTVVALDLQYYCDGGALLSFAGPDGTCYASLVASDNCYYVPNFQVQAALCRTNTPTNTSTRGPGMFPALFFAEQTIEHAAQFLGMDADDVKVLNFYTSGQSTPYGQPLPVFDIPQMWTQLQATCDYSNRVAAVAAYNASNTWTKQGISFVPVKYGIGFQGAMYGCLVNICIDGSVQVSHSGVEVGQGINTKVAQVAAYELGIPLDLVTVTSTNTQKVPNSDPTGGSITTGVNIKVVGDCCRDLKASLETVSRVHKSSVKGGELSWVDLVQAAYGAGIPLSANGWINPPGTGNAPFDYSSYGVCCSQVQVDLLTGDVQVLRTDILVDVGKSMNPALDIGQIEGAFVMGLGYMLTEQVEIDQSTGILLSLGTWNYKPPSSADIPIEFNVTLLKNAPAQSSNVLSSKATGEPPMALSCSCFYAVRHAINDARAANNLSPIYTIDAPMTVDVIQQSCGVTPTQFTLS
eukprot:TRINITY_DN12741_c0_g1_i1.p1 TRINITY_DN12741_c0_g1~~TRINITY_DN12741_c0_g1_i1.p1  ORF type:complete len:1615 (-),score=361.72 TRINITY_DN12741_c0_g1_i1:55-4899(-)